MLGLAVAILELTGAGGADVSSAAAISFELLSRLDDCNARQSLMGFHKIGHAPGKNLPVIPGNHSYFVIQVNTCAIMYQLLLILHLATVKSPDFEVFECEVRMKTIPTVTCNCKQ